MPTVGIKMKPLFDRLFPERQIYHRSDGSVKYVSITPLKQALAAGLLTILAGWCIYASIFVILNGRTLLAHSDAQERQTAKYERWIQQSRAKEVAALSLLEERTNSFNQAMEELERRHETLKSLLQSLHDIRMADSPPPLEGNGANILIDASLDQADIRQSRSLPLPVPSSDIAGLKSQFSNLEYEQALFLNQAEMVMVEETEQLRSVVAMTGIDENAIIVGNERGGPLIEIENLGLPGLAATDNPEFQRRIKQISTRLAEAKYYEKLINTIPIGSPVGAPYRETSHFGIRIDPFSRRPAFHNGLDLAAHYRAPIIASGPGKVTFAGYMSGYGRMVEIDHGFGFKSRYGHLHSISVSKGDIVPLGQKLGRMGSTGRSTGPHLHFEVRFRDKGYDPVKFLRAGKHVYEK